MLAVLIDEIAIWYGSTSHRFFDHGDVGIPHLPSSLACSQNPSPFRWHLYYEVHTVAHLPKTWRNHGHIRKKLSNSSWDGFHLKTGQVEWGDIVTISTGKVDKPPSTVLYVILFWQKKKVASFIVIESPINFDNSFRCSKVRPPEEFGASENIKIRWAFRSPADPLAMSPDHSLQHQTAKRTTNYTLWLKPVRFSCKKQQFQPFAGSGGVVSPAANSSISGGRTLQTQKLLRERIWLSDWLQAITLRQINSTTNSKLVLTFSTKMSPNQQATVHKTMWHSKSFATLCIHKCKLSLPRGLVVRRCLVAELQNVNKKNYLEREGETMI